MTINSSKGNESVRFNSSMSSDKPDYTDYWNKQAQGTPFEGLGDAVKDVPRTKELLQACYRLLEMMEEEDE